MVKTIETLPYKSKEEAEIAKITAEINAIKRNSTGVFTHPGFKTIIGAIAGTILFVAAILIFPDKYFENQKKIQSHSLEEQRVKNKIALAQAELASLDNERLVKLHKIRTEALEAANKELDEQFQQLLLTSKAVTETETTVSDNSDKSVKEAVRTFQNAQVGLKSTINNLKFIGTQWIIAFPDGSHTITLDKEEKIRGFGVPNDYWSFDGQTLTLYTGANSGKESWTSKWTSNSITENIITGTVKRKKENTTQQWTMTKLN